MHVSDFLSAIASSNKDSSYRYYKEKEEDIQIYKELLGESYLDVVDSHLTDLALAGLADLVCMLSCPLLSRDDLPQHLGGNLILLSLLGLHESLSQKLPGRCGDVMGITQPNGGTYLRTSNYKC